MNDRRARGFSVAELLVVVAIIGLLSLVSVPAFINYQKTMKIRGALRTMATDLRLARQIAISRSVRTRIEITGANTYRLMRSEDNGTTWVNQPFRLQTGDTATTGNTRTLDQTVTISATTFFDDDDNDNADLDFLSNGTTLDEDVATSGETVTLTTAWEDAGINRCVITVSSTGQLSSTEDKV